MHSSTILSLLALALGASASPHPPSKDVCHKEPYAGYATLSSYKPANEYCESKYPAKEGCPTVKKTVTVTKTTSNSHCDDHTSPPSYHTPPPYYRRDASPEKKSSGSCKNKAGSWKQLSKKPHELKTFCSCNGYPKSTKTKTHTKTVYTTKPCPKKSTTTTTKQDLTTTLDTSTTGADSSTTGADSTTTSAAVSTTSEETSTTTLDTTVSTTATASLTSTTSATCKPQFDFCTEDSQCCPGLTCQQGLGLSQCMPPSSSTTTTATSSDVSTTTSASTTSATCKPQFDFCTEDSQCCPGLTCQQGLAVSQCMPPSSTTTTTATDSSTASATTTTATDSSTESSTTTMTTSTTDMTTEAPTTTTETSSTTSESTTTSTTAPACLTTNMDCMYNSQCCSGICGDDMYCED